MKVAQQTNKEEKNVSSVSFKARCLRKAKQMAKKTTRKKIPALLAVLAVRGIQTGVIRLSEKTSESQEGSPLQKLSAALCVLINP